MEKKEMKISLPTFIITLLIFAIIIIVMAFVIVKQSQDKKYQEIILKNEAMTNASNNEKGSLVDTNKENNTIINETANSLTNEVTNETTATNKNEEENKVQEEKGEEIGSDNKIVKDIRKKFDYSCIIDALYQKHDFNINNMSNDLKLILGWNYLDLYYIEDYVDGEKSSDGIKINHVKDEVIVDEEKLDESIKNVFGENVSYTKQSFELPSNKIFDIPAGIFYVKYSNGKYTAGIGIGGLSFTYIEELFDKAIKYSDKIEIYVRPQFINSILDENGGETRTIYSDVDFKGEKLKNKVCVLSEQEHEKGEKIKKYKDKLHTYKYTYTIDSNTGDYYFEGFEFVK